ncbi:MAG: hypothetical protein CVT99_00215 [Bacteroidetes bacterium HGW-Bacteroidetes-16]|jgi:hypothetical protein|nr:MAG: hypothetical protein CVT99_00215 [Bacteroidetes bacterium HGW-Bacteroidetes-16]
MKKILFIHIGLHKTGTTAIQSFMAINRDLLKKHKILYPGDFDNHYPIVSELEKSKKPYLDKLSQTYLVFSEIKNNFKKYQKFVLSSEGFIEKDTIILPRLLQTIEFFQLDVLVQIVIFCRPQPSWYESAYNQLIRESKVRFTDSFEAFFRARSIYEINNYYLLLNRWSAYFGKENMILTVYDPKQDRLKLFSDFKQLLGIPFDLSMTSPPKAASNISLRLEAIEFLRWLNILEIDAGIFERIVKIFSSETKKPATRQHWLSPEKAKMIYHDFEATNRMVAHEYLNKTNGILFDNYHIEDSDTLSNPFVQLDYFNPALFSQDIELIRQSEPSLLMDLYSQLYQANSPTIRYANTKDCFLTLIDKLVSETDLIRIRQTASNCQTDDYDLLQRYEKAKSVLEISTKNFQIKTFDWSDHILNGIDLDQCSIRINSTGDDPYFCLEKVIGNFDSITFIRIKIDVPGPTVLRCYYKTRVSDVYSETQSKFKEARPGLKYVFIEIDDPEFNGELRVDPGDVAGVYYLYEIVVKSTAKSYEDLLYENRELKMRYFNLQQEETQSSF